MKHYIHKTFIAVIVSCMKGGVHNLNEKREQKSVFKSNTRGKLIVAYLTLISFYRVITCI